MPDPIALTLIGFGEAGSTFARAAGWEMAARAWDVLAVRCAAVVEAAGGRYVDVAVLAPVDPARMNVPLLVVGPAAK